MGFFSGSEIQPQQVPFGLEGQLERLFDWLFSPFMFNQDSQTWEMRGVPPYPGQLSPDQNNTMLPNVWQSWQPWNAATQHIAGTMGQNPTPQLPGLMDSFQQFGGAGGVPTDRMRQMMDWGGAGKKGLPAMDMMMQYGAPSQVGQFMSSAAQFGIPSEAGRFVHDRASGQPTAAMDFLTQFLQRPTAPTNPLLMQFAQRPPVPAPKKIGG